MSPHTDMKYLLLTILAFAVPSTWAQPSAAAVQVSTAELRQLAPSVQAAGEVLSSEAAAMAAALPGTLQWVAEPGAWLEADEVIARLDASELELQRAEQLARVKRSAINLEQAARELARLTDSGDSVSQFQLDQSRAARDLAESDRDIARVSLRQIDERLSRTVLRAPFAGVVSERLKRSGEEVARGEVIARLLDPADMEIRMFVPLRHVRAVQSGGTVTVHGDRGAFDAQVKSVVPAGSAGSQSFEVVIAAPRDIEWIAPGQLLRVQMPLGQPEQRLSVPRDALIIRTDGISVMRVGADDKAERVSVTLGVADGNWIAVSGGLAEGDRVIVRGGESLNGGEAVKIIGEPSV